MQTSVSSVGEEESGPEVRSRGPGATACAEPSRPRPPQTIADSSDISISMRLCLPRDEASVPFVRHICQHVLDELSVTEDCQAAVLLALTEACDNVVLHATVDDEYGVQIEISADDCQIRVIDDGRGMASAPLETRGDAPANAEHGRGIGLMRALVDTIRFESRPQSGTIVNLVKQLEFHGSSGLAQTPPR